MLLGYFDLLEVANPEEHAFFAFHCGLKVEKVVVLVFVVWGVGHWMVDDEVLDALGSFVLGVGELDLCTSLVVEMNHR